MPAQSLPVAAARQGDADAWDRLFRRYQLPLYTFAVEWLRDEQAALDVVQETFIGAVRHLGSLKSDEKFGSWLFGIAHQKCIQHWRKSSRRQAAEGELCDEIPAQTDDPSDWVIRREDADRVLALLENLPEPQRAVLLLRYAEGFSLEEIAEITASNPGTVKSRLHYAKRALRQLMETDHEPKSA